MDINGKDCFMKKILLSILCLLCFITTTNAAAWQMQQARQEYANGAYTKAIKTLTDAINSTNYVDVDAYKLRASAYIKLNSPVSAINDLNFVIQEQPTAENYNRRAWANIKAKKYWDAIEDFGETIKLDKTGNLAEKGLRYILNDKNIPIEHRIDAGRILSLLGQKKYGNLTPQQVIPFLKCLKIITDTDENNDYFKHKGSSKSNMINDYVSLFDSSDSTESGLGNEIMQGYCIYITKDKILGKKIVNGVIKELKTKYPYDESMQSFCSDINKIMNTIENPNF